MKWNQCICPSFLQNSLQIECGHCVFTFTVGLRPVDTFPYNCFKCGHCVLIKQGIFFLYLVLADLWEYISIVHRVQYIRGVFLTFDTMYETDTDCGLVYLLMFCFNNSFIIDVL